ncbi:hypothetical protein ACRRTK_021122 [Alexandromys fortis]
MTNQKCIKYLEVLITKSSCDDGVGDNGVEKEPPAKLDVIQRTAKEKKMRVSHRTVAKTSPGPHGTVETQPKAPPEPHIWAGPQTQRCKEPPARITGPQPEAGRSRLLTDLPGSVAPAQPRAAPACLCPPRLGGPVSTCSPARRSPVLLSPRPARTGPGLLLPRAVSSLRGTCKGVGKVKEKKRNPKKVQGRVEGEERRGGSKPHRPTSKLSEDLCRRSVISTGCRGERRAGTPGSVRAAAELTA